MLTTTPGPLLTQIDLLLCNLVSKQSLWKGDDRTCPLVTPVICLSEPSFMDSGNILSFSLHIYKSIQENIMYLLVFFVSRKDAW